MAGNGRGTSTPLVESVALAKALGVRKVLLKIESCQPTGSFKDRGMAVLCRESKKQHGAERVVSSSGGNAGLAAANAARDNGMRATVIVPETTKPEMVDKIRALGAEVEVHGENWNAADARARSICEQDPKASYAPPFDNPLVWQGNSTLVDELVEQLAAPPDAIFASVGGGGLIAGVFLGLERAGGAWAQTPVVAAETEGANCMNAAFAAGKPVAIPAITSVATSLGALQVAQGAFDKARAHPGGCESVVVSDKAAVQACLDLADNQRVMVEPACGASLAAARALLDDASRAGKLGGGKPRSELDLLVIVCGGSGASLAALSGWKERFGL